MKVLTRLLGALIFIVIILAGIGFFLPSSVTVTRSAAIDAPPATVYELVNGFRHFNKFSPWAEIDPATRYEFRGPERGEGAVMEWRSSNPDVGHGIQTVVSAEPYAHVETSLDFVGKGTAMTRFDLQQSGDSTAVTWSFDMDFGNNLVARYMGLLMEEYVGADYEKGLARLKKLAESFPKVDIAGFELEETTIEPAKLLLTTKRTTMTPEEMVASMSAAFVALDTILTLNEVEASDRYRVITEQWNEEEQVWIFDAARALPADTFLTVMADGIRQETGYAGTALTTTLQGADWEQSASTYEKAALYMSLRGWQTMADSWESYPSNPASTPPAELVTTITWPVSKKPLQ